MFVVVAWGLGSLECGLTIRFPVSRPLVSALASALRRRSRRNSADLTGWRARETPNCLPVGIFVSLGCTERSCAVDYFVCLPVHRNHLCVVAYLLTLCTSSGAASISPHGNGLLHLLHVLQVLDRSLNFPTIDCLCGFSGVLEADSEVRATTPRRLGRRDVLRCVADLDEGSVSILFDLMSKLGLGSFAVCGLTDSGTRHRSRK